MAGEGVPDRVMHCPGRVHTMKEVEDNMEFIQERLEKLKDLMKDAALPGFDDDNSKHDSIELLASSISERFGRCQVAIKRMGVPDRKDQTADEDKTQKNAQVALATRLQALSSEFRKSQSAYMNRLKGTEARMKQMFSDFGNDDEDAEEERFDLGFTDDQVQQVNDQVELVNQREREINQLAQSIGDLAQIFRDMQTLVLEQGTIVDRIDYNIQQTVVLVSDGHKELVEGDKYQKKYRTKLCILLLIVVVVALVIALAFKPKSSGEVIIIVTPPPGNGTMRGLRSVPGEGVPADDLSLLWYTMRGSIQAWLS